MYIYLWYIFDMSDIYTYHIYQIYIYVFDSKIMHNDSWFNLFILHNNSFDNQRSEYIYIYIYIYIYVYIYIIYVCICISLT